MSVYKKQDVMQTCQLIADALHVIKGQLETDSANWVEVKNMMTRIEARAAEGCHISSNLYASEGR